MRTLQRSYCTTAAALILLAALGSPGLADQAADAGDSKVDSQAEVGLLIQQLGDESYATRERAQAELARLGAAAFDQLYFAQAHDDIEIALRAKFLVRSIDLRWIRESDPVEVQRALKAYSTKDVKERESRLIRLKTLEDYKGVEPLCRIARYELNDILAKKAALAVLAVGAPQDKTGKEALAAKVKATVRSSPRTSTTWLRLYAQTLVSPQTTFDEWRRLTDAEIARHGEFPSAESQTIVIDLLRWRATTLREHGENVESVAAIHQMFDLLDGDHQTLISAVDWLIHLKAWDEVDRLLARFDKFDQHPDLLYRLAEKQLESGAAELAEETARRALELNPELFSSHVEIAQSLYRRGRKKWAEREYKSVIERGVLASVDEKKQTYRDLAQQPVLFAEMPARINLADMLHDSGREFDAANALKAIVDAMNKFPQLETLFRSERQPQVIRARYHYYMAQHVRNSSPAEHRKQLKLAIDVDPEEVDVLIAMYRAAGDDAWRSDTLIKIKKVVAELQNLIQQQQRDLETSKQRREQEDIEGRERIVASLCNQLAWLISNTDGDYQEAVRLSQLSNELWPDNAAYLDTLGRCYYAVGDYAKAVKHQKQAVAQEPHSEIIANQLKLFEDALAKQKQTHERGQ